MVGDDARERERGKSRREEREKREERGERREERGERREERGERKRDETSQRSRNSIVLRERADFFFKNILES